MDADSNQESVPMQPAGRSEEQRNSVVSDESPAHAGTSGATSAARRAASATRPYLARAADTAAGLSQRAAALARGTSNSPHPAPSATPVSTLDSASTSGSPSLPEVLDHRHLPAVIHEPAPTESTDTPVGWWQASDGNWCPPETHPALLGAARNARPSASEVTIAVAANIGGAFPLAGFLIPLCLFMTLRKNQIFARNHVVGALNLQGTLALATVTAGLLSAFIFPVLIWFAYAITVFVVSVIGAVTARQGEPYRYPFGVSFVRTTTRRA